MKMPLDDDDEAEVELIVEVNSILPERNFRVSSEHEASLVLAS